MADTSGDGSTGSINALSATPTPDANSAGVSSAPAPNVNRPDERQVEEPSAGEANGAAPAAGDTVRAPEITQASSPISSACASAALQLQETSLRPPSPRSTPASPTEPSIAQPHTLALSDPQAQAAGGNTSPQHQSQSANRPRNRSMGDAPRVDGGSTSSSQTSPVEKRGLGKVVGPARELLDEGGIEGADDELELSVPSHQEHLTADGQRYTTYEIVIRFGGRQWSVRKRYSQFDQFRHSLRKQHKEVGSFRFPNKSKFNTFSEHTKERRRTGFDEFLRLVAGLHPRPQEVDVFLAMDEHGAGVHGRVAGRPLAWTSGSVSPVSTPVGGAPLPPGWPEDLCPREGERIGHAGGARSSGQGTTPRVPRFPPLADQGRREKAAEAAAAAAAVATMARAQSKNAPPGIVSQVDQELRRILGPDLLSVLCVIAVSAVSIVAVWKVGGKPGLATLVIAVSVGLFIQNWDRGVDVLTMGLEMVGLAAPESSDVPSPARVPTGPRSAELMARPRAGSAPVVRSPRSQTEQQ